MSIKEIVRKMMLHRGVNQGSVARMAGWNSQAGLSLAISRRSPSMQTLLRVCDALGFDVVVRDRVGDTEWVLSPVADREESDKKC